jgi:tetratricopeptide (TPR) repeat protein
MSKPYPPSNAPEFASQHDYSDILSTSSQRSSRSQSTSSDTPRQNSPKPAAIIDPWASQESSNSAPPVAAPPQLVALDPWASEETTSVPVAPTRLKSSHSARLASVKCQNIQAQAVKTVAPPEPEVSMRVPASSVNLASDPALTATDLALKYCKRGSKSLAAKDYAQARSAYKIAIEWNPQLAAAHIGIATICYQSQDYEGALVACDLAIGYDSAQLDFYYQRALVNKALKNYYQVLADCKKILEQVPNHPSAGWLNAVALVKIESYQLALPSLNQHIKTYPQDPSGYCYRGICYERLAKFTSALTDLDRAISLQSNQPTFHHARGRTRQKLGDLPGALADFNITIARKPHASVYDDRAEVHRCLNNHLEALQDCDRAIELNPKFISAYFRRGLTYAELGDLELALANYTSTIDLDPEHGKALVQRSLIYFRQQDYRHAKQDCQAVKAFDKTCFWSNYILGIIDSLSGLQHSAIKSFSKAIELAPNYVSARYHRGIVYHELGDIPKAIADFEQARSIQNRGLERLVDRDETGFYAEGLALYHLGQLEAARKVLTMGALSAKRFNNPSFHQLILAKIESLGLKSSTTAD